MNERVLVHCSQCGAELRRRLIAYGPRKGLPYTAFFCNFICKAAWQRSQHPVDNEWLRQKYVVEQLTAVDIAAMVGRDPKSVWTWLRNAGIQTRKRGTATILKGFGFRVGQLNGFAGRKHSDAAKEAIRRARLADGHVPYLKNGVHYLKGKRGAETPNWRGGVTPERNAFYSSDAWKSACKIVWRRDDAKCRRCQFDHRSIPIKDRGSFHIHHIVSFSNRALRADPDNLVLLGSRCHRWVHGKQNKERLFLG